MDEIRKEHIEQQQNKFTQIIGILSKAFEYHNIKFDLTKLTYLSKQYYNNIAFCIDIINNIKFHTRQELINMINTLSDFWLWVPREELENQSIASIYSNKLKKTIPLPNHQHLLDMLTNMPSSLPSNKKTELLKIMIDDHIQHMDDFINEYIPEYILEKKDKKNYEEMSNNIKTTIDSIVKNLDAYDENKKIQAIKIWFKYITDNQVDISKRDVDIYSASLEYLIKSDFNKDQIKKNTELLKILSNKYRIKNITTLRDIIKKIALNGM